MDNGYLKQFIGKIAYTLIEYGKCLSIPLKDSGKKIASFTLPEFTNALFVDEKIIKSYEGSYILSLGTYLQTSHRACLISLVNYISMLTSKSTYLIWEIESVEGMGRLEKYGELELLLCEFLAQIWTLYNLDINSKAEIKLGGFNFKQGEVGSGLKKTGNVYDSMTTFASIINKIVFDNMIENKAFRDMLEKYVHMHIDRNKSLERQAVNERYKLYLEEQLTNLKKTFEEEKAARYEDRKRMDKFEEKFLQTVASLRQTSSHTYYEEKRNVGYKARVELEPQSSAKPITRRKNRAIV